MSGVPHLRRQFASLMNRPDSVDYISASQGFTGPGGYPLQIMGLAQQLGWLLHYSEAHEARKADPLYQYRRGLDPALVAPIVRRAHVEFPPFPSGD